MAVALAAALVAAPAVAKPFDPEQACAGPQTPPKKAPKFEDYAVEPATTGWMTLKLKSQEARKYATQLRRAYPTGATFAGFYRLATWGCGADCTQFAIVDGRNGEVLFDDEVRKVADAPWNPFDRLTVRPDSRLVMLSGAPNQDDRRNGVAFYAWTGDRLILLKRFHYDEVCRAPKFKEARRDD